MRNPHRTAGPIKRTVPVPVPAEPVSRNLLLRTHTDIAPSMPVRRTSYTPVGGPSKEWRQSMYLRPTDAAMTPAWGYTRSRRRV